MRMTRSDIDAFPRFCAIPPGYFTELGVKTTSLSGEENIKALNQALLQMDEFMYDEAKESVKKILKTL